jgi:hypothetical protein
MKLSEQLAAMNKANEEVAETLSTVAGLPAVPPALQEIADELSELHSQKKALEDKIIALKSQAMAFVDDGTLGQGDTVETTKGDPAFSMRRTGRTFDAIQAATVLPPAVIESISTKQIDGKVAKAKLPPELYDKCKKPGRINLVLR